MVILVSRRIYHLLWQLIHSTILITHSRDLHTNRIIGLAIFISHVYIRRIQRTHISLRNLVFVLDVTWHQVIVRKHYRIFQVPAYEN